MSTDTMTDDEQDAEIAKKEVFIRDELEKLAVWGERGDWSLVVIGRCFKEYRSDTLQPLLDIFLTAMEWAVLCQGVNNEWREWRILKNAFESMGSVEVPFQEVYCWFVVRGGNFEIVPPHHLDECWEAINRIASEDLAAKTAINSARSTLTNTDEPSQEISLFLKRN